MYMERGRTEAEIGQLSLHNTPMGLRCRACRTPTNRYTIMASQTISHCRLTTGWMSVSTSATTPEKVLNASVIPAEFPLETIKLIQKPENQSMLQFQIRFTDPAATPNRYAVRVERKQMFWNNGVYTEDLHLRITKSMRPVACWQGRDAMRCRNPVLSSV